MTVQLKQSSLLKGSALTSCWAMMLLSLGFSQAASGSTPAVQPDQSMAPLRVVFPVIVQIPDLPNLGDPTQYLPENARTIHLVLKLGQRRVYVYRGDEVLASYPVAIGTPDDPTPVGEFEVFQMIENPVWRSPWTGEVRSPGPNSALGLRWIGFTTLPQGVVGFHGTPTVSSIGQAASHGCVRMRNEDVVALFDQVEIGTAVIVEP